MFFNRQELLVFLVFCLFIAFPPALNADFGVSGWPIFKKIQSSQFESLSMLSPVNPDLTGSVYNPAILGFARHKELLLLSERGFAGDRFGAFIYSVPAGKGMLAFGGAYYDAGISELCWIDNGQLMSRNVSVQRDYMGMAAFEHPLGKRIYAGITLKAATSVLAEDASASAFAGDLGFIYAPRASRNGRMTYALVLQNAGKASAFVQTEDKLPETIYAGSACALKLSGLDVILAAGAGFLIPDEKINPEAGIEIGGSGLSLNAGCKFWNSESNVQLGLRMTINNVSYGYAFLPSADLEAVHRLTIAFHFLRYH
jgi:hypothetical protein